MYQNSYTRIEVLFVVLMIVVVAFGLWFNFITPTFSEKVYPLMTAVVEVNRDSDIVTCVDFNGNFWEFSECDDWMVGDIANLLMNTKGTANIYDDEIISVKYDGYIR